jgi:hypothetical protein
MGFRATNFTVAVLLLMALTIFMAWLRNKKPLDNSWPLIYWFMVFLFTLVREEDTYNLNIILVGLVAGLMLRFEFMNAFFIRLMKTIELLVWGYVLYRGYQIITY